MKKVKLLTLLALCLYIFGSYENTKINIGNVEFVRQSQNLFKSIQEITESEIKKINKDQGDYEIRRMGSNDSLNTCFISLALYEVEGLIKVRLPDEGERDFNYIINNDKDFPFFTAGDEKARAVFREKILKNLYPTKDKGHWVSNATKFDGPDVSEKLNLDQKTNTDDSVSFRKHRNQLVFDDFVITRLIYNLKDAEDKRLYISENRFYDSKKFPYSKYFIVTENEAANEKLYNVKDTSIVVPIRIEEPNGYDFYLVVVLSFSLFLLTLLLITQIFRNRQFHLITRDIYINDKKLFISEDDQKLNFKTLKNLGFNAEKGYVNILNGTIKQKAFLFWPKLYTRLMFENTKIDLRYGSTIKDNNNNCLFKIEQGKLIPLSEVKSSMTTLEEFDQALVGYKDAFSELSNRAENISGIINTFEHSYENLKNFAFAVQEFNKLKNLEELIALKEKLGLEKLFNSDFLNKIKTSIDFYHDAQKISTIDSISKLSDYLNSSDKVDKRLKQEFDNLEYCFKNYQLLKEASTFEDLIKAAKDNHILEPKILGELNTVKLKMQSFDNARKAKDLDSLVSVMKQNNLLENEHDVIHNYKRLVKIASIYNDIVKETEFSGILEACKKHRVFFYNTIREIENLETRINLSDRILETTDMKGFIKIVSESENKAENLFKRSFVNNLDYISNVLSIFDSLKVTGTINQLLSVFESHWKYFEKALISEIKGIDEIIESQKNDIKNLKNKNQKLDNSLDILTKYKNSCTVIIDKYKQLSDASEEISRKEIEELKKTILSISNDEDNVQLADMLAEGKGKKVVDLVIENNISLVKGFDKIKGELGLVNLSASKSKENREYFLKYILTIALRMHYMILFYAYHKQNKDLKPSENPFILPVSFGLENYMRLPKGYKDYAGSERDIHSFATTVYHFAKEAGIDEIGALVEGYYISPGKLKE